MNCAKVGCELPTSGKSKYCRPHAREARALWLDKVKTSCQEREQRNGDHAALWARAMEAARKAHADAVPAPMIVADAHLDGTLVEGGERHYVREGACGFGYVTVSPGNCSFALWLRKHANAYKHYYGGVRVSMNLGGAQSVARAEAAAYAASDVLREAGVKAYACSNLD